MYSQFLSDNSLFNDLIMMKKLLLLFVVLGLGQCKSTSNKNTDELAAEFAKNIQSQTLQDKLSTLASDDFQGRETGEPGQQKAAEYLKTFYEKNGIKPALGEEFFQTIPAGYFKPEIGETQNVASVIKGNEFPEQIVVVSAHYDHLGVKQDGQIYNGADDNASGTVAVMEIAKAFKKAKESGQGPKRTILFLHFTGEEKGLLGSKYYTENPIFPLENTVVDLNTDMIGRVDDAHQNTPNYIYLIGSDRLSSALDSVINRQNRKYTHLALDYTYNAEDDPNRFYYRSDHYNFAKHNIPVNFFFNGVHEDYHKPSDTADRIHYDLLAKRARLIFYSAWEVANRDTPLKLDEKE